MKLLFAVAGSFVRGKTGDFRLSLSRVLFKRGLHTLQILTSPFIRSPERSCLRSFAVRAISDLSQPRLRRRLHVRTGITHSSWYGRSRLANRWKGFLRSRSMICLMPDAFQHSSRLQMRLLHSLGL